MALVRDRGTHCMTYSSSIASCVGIGSSKPRPISSHEKVASSPRSRFSIICGSGMVFEAKLFIISGSGLVSGDILETGSVKVVSITSGIDGNFRASGIDGCLGVGVSSAGRKVVSTAVPGRNLEEKSVSAFGFTNEVFGSLDLAFLPSFVLLSWVSTWAVRREVPSISTSMIWRRQYTDQGAPQDL